jgi:hypothetical protein
MLQTIMKRQALVYFSMVRRSAAFFCHNKNCVQSDCHSHVCCQSACISGRAYIYIYMQAHTRYTDPHLPIARHLVDLVQDYDLEEAASSG